ncbi:MAG: asparaginase, partial [Tyzzerella sp.]|nr:asparaginase [Candidatus Fimicola merdigallinarum]
YGMGGIPNTDELNFIPIIEKANAMSIPVIISTQCVYDGVDISTYEVGITAQNAGAISSKNYTIEYASVRLMYMLGNNIDLKYY